VRTSKLAVIGLSSILLGWVLMFVLPGSRFFAWIIMAVGALAVAAAAALDFRRVRDALTSRRGRFGLGTTMTTTIFLAIVFLLNALSLGLYRRFDLTGTAQFALSSQTRQVLADLDRDVEVTALFSPAVPAATSAYARELLSEYAAYSGRLTLRDIDPEVQPDEARRRGLDQTGALLGAVVFRSGDRRRQVFGPQITARAEHAFTTALLEVTGARQKKIYFVTGHGEAGIYAEYRLAADGLRDNLFAVDELDLGVSAVPSDAAALVIAGPRTAPTRGELESIRSYVNDGGHLLLLVDPDPPQAYRDLVSEWWMDIAPGDLIDPTSHVAPDPSSPLVPRSRNSLQIGETYFRGATAILPREARPEGVELAPLAWTSDDAWLETGAVPPDEATFDPATDRKGPFAIAVLMASPPADTRDPARATRIVVMGDSDFASAGDFRNGANSTLFLTGVNWLTAGEQVISIDRKSLVTRRLLLNPEQERFLHVSSIGLLPLVLLLAGAAVWWQRQRQG
jgi:ABC-type uncharacterized transport system involved in gliding motility auxiliary subunit